MIRPWLARSVALTLAMGATAARAEIKLAPSDNDGVIAFQLKPADLLKDEKFYQLDMSLYDPQDHLMKATSFGGWAEATDLGKGQTEETFHLIKVKPGLYVISRLSVQGIWGLCYNKASVYFEVKPGTVTYIGELDPAPEVAAIRQAVKARRLKSYARNGAPQTLFDDYAAPLKAPDQAADWKTAYATYIAAKAPGLTAPVEAAELKPAHFGTGRDAFGLGRICGGYYAKAERDGETASAAPPPKP